MTNGPRAPRGSDGLLDTILVAILLELAVDHCDESVPRDSEIEIPFAVEPAMNVLVLQLEGKVLDAML